MDTGTRQVLPGLRGEVGGLRQLPDGHQGASGLHHHSERGADTFSSLAASSLNNSNTLIKWQHCTSRLLQKFQRKITVSEKRNLMLLLRGVESDSLHHTGVYLCLVTCSALPARHTIRPGCEI
jgi:hypothetical protein